MKNLEDLKNWNTWSFIQLHIEVRFNEFKVEGEKKEEEIKVVFRGGILTPKNWLTAPNREGYNQNCTKPGHVALQNRCIADSENQSNWTKLPNF